MTETRWAARMPGYPDYWMLDTTTRERADACPIHEEMLDDGLCVSCRTERRAA